MKPVQHHRSFLFISLVAATLLLSCNANEQEKKVQSEPNVASDHPATEATGGVNAVKSEAPDAQTKVEQGYAFPNDDQHLAQSPINIISKNVVKGQNEKISFDFHSNIAAAENLGHTIQIDFKEGSTCVSNGKDYAARQFHFHTPSEHLIDGITYPMEMHIVNALTDSNKSTSYLVVSILFKMGGENPFLKEFLDKVPNKEDKNELQVGQVKLEDLFAEFPKSEMHSYYSYKGSLTTPPYTESVQWVILKHVVEASEEQIISVEKLEGNNARHVQALHERKVFSQ